MKFISLLLISLCLLLQTATAQSAYLAGPDLAVSADGNYLYGAWDRGFLNEIRAGDGQVMRRIPLDVPGRYYGVGVGADGRYAAVATGEGVVAVVDLKAGRQVRRFRVSDRELYKVKITDSRLIVSGREGPIRELDLLSGEVLATYDKGETSNEGLDSSDDGRYLLAGNHDGSIQLFDRRTGEEKFTLLNPFINQTNGCSDLLSADIAPGGRLGAVTGCGGQAIIIDLEKGTILRSLEGFPDFATEVAFSPDGEQVAVSGLEGDIRILEVRSGKVLRELPAVESDGLQFYVTYALQGKRLAASGPYFPLRLFDTRDGSQRAILPGS